MKYFHFVYLLCFLVLPPFLNAADIPSRPSSYITDQAQVIVPQHRLQLESVLVDLKQKTGVEMAVLTLPTLGDETSIEGLATALFEKWGLGEKGKDNGLLLLVAIKEKKMRIEVGYGLEELIPDGLAGQIIDETLVPAFRTGDYSKGLVAGTLTLASLIAKKNNVTLSVGPPHARRSGGQRRPVSLLQRILGLVFFLLMIPVVIRYPWLLFFLLGSGRGGGGFGGGFGGGGFGGFGGGLSGGGGASR